MKWWAWATLAASMIRGRAIARVAQADVDERRVGEDEVGLEDGRHLGPDRLQGHVAEVVAVDPDPARPWGR